MLDLAVILVVAVAIPALLVLAVTIRDWLTGEHPHRRLSDR